MELTIDLKSLQKSELHIEEFVILALINAGEDINSYPCYEITLIALEENMYLKSTEEGYELRGKGRELFVGNQLKEDAIEVLNYLNKKYKEIKPRARGYDAVPSNLKFITARLKEKNTAKELCLVVDEMCKRWKGTKFEDYLRPATLFNGEKFQSYRNYAAESIRLSKTTAM